MKKCIKCGVEKKLDEFYNNNASKDKKISWCKKCSKVYKKQYYEKNKKDIAQQIKQHRLLPEIKKHTNNYMKEYQKQPEVKKYQKEYHKHPKIKEQKRKYMYSRYTEDFIFRLRCIVSKTIRMSLKNQNARKNSSTFSKLPYSPQQLKEHLEKQFEPWMTWENYGKYDENKRTWQIDHIIPQSLLLYDSMDHPNFQLCWALENLRPLETIKNIRKGDKLILDTFPTHHELGYHQK